LGWIVARRLGTAAHVIIYDKRGVGLSDRIESPATVEQQVADAEVIMRAARSERVTILAVSDGTTVATHLAVRRPQQVAGLLIYDGQAKGVRSVDYPWGLTPEQYQRWADRVVRGWGGPIHLEYFAPTHAQDERLRPWWAQMQRLAPSPSAVKIILGEFSRVTSGTVHFLIAAAHVRLAPRS